MATDAANAKTEEDIKAEEERAMRILEYKRELAESGSEEELAIQKEILEENRCILKEKYTMNY